MTWHSILDVPSLGYMPSMKYSLALFTTSGFFIAGTANLVSNMPFFFRPRRHVYGLVIGGIAGYLIHTAADFRRVEKLKEQIWERRELERRSKLVEEALKESGQASK